LSEGDKDKAVVSCLLSFFYFFSTAPSGEEKQRVLDIKRKKRSDNGKQQRG
ncbi:hypothetical protein CCACVL1_11872, partial [Corchorus capsularis]